MLQILLNKMQAIAKELHFTGFMKTWNAYVESKSPKATILGSNQTMFPKQPTQLDCGQYIADEYGVSRMNEMAFYIHFENVDFRKLAWYSHHPEVQDNTTNQLSVL